MKTTIFTSLLVGTVALSAAPAGAQLNLWRLNEVVGRTIGGTDTERGQYIELYHPNPGESVTGLTIVVIRPALTVGGGGSGRWNYRVDLTGSAQPGSNFFVVANQNYVTPPASAPALGPFDQIAVTAPSNWFMRPGGATQGHYQEVHLVLTSDILPSYTPVATTGGYLFNPTVDFGGGSQLLDGVYLVSSTGPGNIDDNGIFVSTVPGTDPRLVPHPTSTAAAPPGAIRSVDGTGAWIGLDIVDGANNPMPVGSLPFRTTPGASNVITNVSDWFAY